MRALSPILCSHPSSPATTLSLSPPYTIHIPFASPFSLANPILTQLISPTHYSRPFSLTPSPIHYSHTLCAPPLAHPVSPIPLKDTRGIVTKIARFGDPAAPRRYSRPESDVVEMMDLVETSLHRLNREMAMKVR